MPYRPISAAAKHYSYMVARRTLIDAIGCDPSTYPFITQDTFETNEEFFERMDRQIRSMRSALAYRSKKKEQEQERIARKFYNG